MYSSMDRESAPCQGWDGSPEEEFHRQIIAFFPEIDIYPARKLIQPLAHGWRELSHLKFRQPVETNCAHELVAGQRPGARIPRKPSFGQARNMSI